MQDLSNCDGRGEGDGQVADGRVAVQVNADGGSSNKDRGHQMQGSIFFPCTKPYEILENTKVFFSEHDEAFAKSDFGIVSSAIRVITRLHFPPSNRNVI